MIARVRFVTFFLTRSGLTLNDCGSMSTNTGFAPSRAIDPAVAKKVKLGQITSSPGLTPSAISAQSSASVPLETPIACLVPQYSARLFSNRST
jgi:hypothetical protein